ncbi:MAG: 3'3'-cGAMP-specific phosphodiesterase 3 [Chlamydiae bacterium]|nr:3'3'-cGAMP-specific phosphodiesterase 3 [Chlamydiota bacterium]
MLREARLSEIGIALSKEREIPVLLRKILVGAKELTEADGGTIYMVTPEKRLKFEVVLSDTLEVHEPPSFTLPLFQPDGSPIESMMVSYAVHHKKTIHIADAYKEEGFDFSGTREFDEKTGYRTRTVLTIPMKNHEEEVIAVLQLLNPPEGRIFTGEEIALAESLASQAGMFLTNQILIKNLRGLFTSLIQVIAEAIDEKSPSTGNHGKRVPIVAEALANAVSRAEEGPFSSTSFSSEDLYELEVAAFLHDCGKITTPEYIMEKKTKLETFFDRIEVIEARAASLRKSPEEIEEIVGFLKRCNEGKEAITDEVRARVKEIAKLPWGGKGPFLTEEEVEHLVVEKGNLTEKEREILENHVVMTYRMLSKLTYPKDLKRVPEIAASHHEWINGHGYPRGLKGGQMSLQAKILAVADVFEALSAPDRPYKKPLPLSKIFSIMENMAEEGHLDLDLLTLFRTKKVYLPYAERFLSPEQIDV